MSVTAGQVLDVLHVRNNPLPYLGYSWLGLLFSVAARI